MKKLFFQILLINLFVYIIFYEYDRNNSDPLPCASMCQHPVPKFLCDLPTLTASGARRFFLLWAPTRLPLYQAPG